MAHIWRCNNQIRFCTLKRPLPNGNVLIQTHTFLLKSRRHLDDRFSAVVASLSPCLSTDILDQIFAIIQVRKQVRAGARNSARLRLEVPTNHSACITRSAKDLYAVSARS
jgi:hypothetical protein